MLVIYGFHPQELFAEDVGKKLKEIDLKNVEVIRFRPACIPDYFQDYDKIPLEEQRLLDREGRRELWSFIQREYGRIGLLLDLHETPFVWGWRMPDSYKFGIYYQGRNLKLKQVIKDFLKTYPEKRIDEEAVFATGDYSRTVTMEFYSKYKEGNEARNMTNEEGLEFALDVIHYLFDHYLHSPLKVQRRSSQTR